MSRGKDFYRQLQLQYVQRRNRVFDTDNLYLQ